MPSALLSAAGEARGLMAYNSRVNPRELRGDHCSSPTHREMIPARVLRALECPQQYPRWAGTGIPLWVGAGDFCAIPVWLVVASCSHEIGPADPKKKTC